MRLIDAESLREKIRYECGWDCWGRVSETDVLTKIDIAPTIDAAPVVHASWISEVVTKCDWKGRLNQYYQPCSCSACHEPAFREYKFCPNCGAKMDGDQHDSC